MLKLIYQHQFEKDLKRIKLRHKDLSKLNEIIRLLMNNIQLPAKNRNHKLVGNYEDSWDCHIEPDWVLIYRKTATEIFLVRTGSHADLF